MNKRSPNTCTLTCPLKCENDGTVPICNQLSNAKVGQSISSQRRRWHKQSYIYLSSPIESKHSSFSIHWSFSLWSARYPEEIRLKKKRLRLGSQTVFMWRHSVRLEIGGKEEKPATDLASFTRSAQFIHSKRLSTSLSSMPSFRSSEHVCLKMSKAIWTKFLGRNYVTKRQPGRWVLFQMPATMFKF